MVTIGYPGRTIADVRPVPRRPATATQAREHGISRGAVRTAVVDLMPDRSAAGHQATSAMGSRHPRSPGKFAELLRVTELDDAEWATPPPLPPCTAKPFDGPQGAPTVPDAAQGPPGVRDGRLRFR